MSAEAVSGGFGATGQFGTRLFRVDVPASRTETVVITEEYGYQGGQDGIPFEEVRVHLPRQVWSRVAEAARKEFNPRLRAAKVATGRWKVGVNKVDRLLGRELCVLAWACENANADQVDGIAAKWAALRPEERWWLYSTTNAAAGTAEDSDMGWRRALRHALSDDSEVSAHRKVRPKPAEDQTFLPFEVSK